LSAGYEREKRGEKWAQDCGLEMDGFSTELVREEKVSANVKKY